MRNSFYILHGISFNKKALFGVLFLFPLSVFSRQAQTISLSLTGFNAYTRTIDYCYNNSCSGGFGSLSCPSNFVSINNENGIRYASLSSVPTASGVNCSTPSPTLNKVAVPDDFVITGYSCNVSISGPGNTANVTCTSSNNSSSVGMGNGFFNTGSCDNNGQSCSSACNSWTTTVNCSVTGTTSTNYIPYQSCSDFLPVSDNRCKGGQGLRLQAGAINALHIIETAFGEVSSVGNSSSRFQTLSGAKLLEDISNNQTSVSDTVTRRDGSKCMNSADGNSFNYLLCPFGFENTPEDTTSYNSCPVEYSAPMGLRKVIQERKAEKETAPDYALSWESQPYYDALGRKTQDNPNTRRYLFEDNKNANLTEERSESGLKGLSGSVSTTCYKNVRGEWVCKRDSDFSVFGATADVCGEIGVDYGIIEPDGTMVGGITCPYVSDTTLWSIPINSQKVVGTCADGSDSLEFPITFTIKTYLARNEPFSVPAGYQFPNGYTATEENATAMYYHELGHVAYNNCLKLPVTTKQTYTKNECKSEWLQEQKIKDKYDKEAEELGAESYTCYNKLVDNLRDLFHQNYGTDGYDTTYTCPNK